MKKAAAVFCLAALVTGAAQAQLQPHEARWFERWGIAPADRDDVRKQMQQSRIESRLQEALTAMREGDPVAGYLAQIELQNRCHGGWRQEKRAVLSAEHCAILAYWASHWPRTWPKTRSPEVDRYTSMSYFREGMFEIGKAMEDGVDGIQDYAAARFFYELEAWLPKVLQQEPRRAEMHFRLSRLYGHGLGGPIDRKLAAEHYDQAADNGHVVASYVRATELYQRSQQPGLSAEEKRKMLDDAAYYFANAGRGGVADAAYRYANLLETNQVGRSNGPKLVYEYYRRAAVQGHLPSIAGVARSYWNGWGVPRDPVQAEEWWKRAARAGDPESAWTVYALHTQRDDHAGGAPYLRQAAQGGYPGASESLARWEARGAREQSTGSTFLSVMRYVADVGERQARQREAELAYQMQAQSGYSNVPLWNAQGVGGGGSANTTGSGAGGGGGSRGGSGGGNDGATLTIEKDTSSEDSAATRARMDAELQRQAAASAARAKEYEAKYAADLARSRAEQAARSQRRAIACYGSLEAARNARTSCQ